MNITIGPWYIRLLAHTMKLHSNKRNKTQGYIWNRQHMMVQPPQAHNHENNITTIWKVDTSDLMMIIRLVIDKSSRSPKLEMVRLTTPHIAMKIWIAIERTNYISGPTNSIQYIPNKHIHTYTSRIFHCMCSMQVEANLHDDDTERQQHA